ncbi:hypothetical protein PybrP1_004056 [[Pythium] brassicae (nom. inval.)]|nr:hypothetical protein PybrP1_004056 [[Pythium] brassicae (nom. inval.)]
MSTTFALLRPSPGTRRAVVSPPRSLIRAFPVSRSPARMVVLKSFVAMGFVLVLVLASAIVAHAQNPNAEGGTNTALNTSGLEHHIQLKIRRGEVPCRGVNLGSWLVAEHWMSWSSPLWEGVPKDVSVQGEFATMKFLGQERGDAAFERHWATWITEDDFAKVASASFNTVRIPVGFWIRYDDPAASHREAYYPKGSLRYVDQAIQWGEKYNLAVLLSPHTHQGSQNGFQHSAPYDVGRAGWSASAANVQNSVELAAFLAARYSSSPAFLGLGLMNEPSSTTDPLVVRDYYQRAYAAVRSAVANGTASAAAVKNDCVLTVSPMLHSQDLNELANFMVDAPGTVTPVYYNVWQEAHSYYLEKLGVGSEVLDAAKIFRANRVDASHDKPLFVGEWSMQTATPLSSTERFREFGGVQLESYASARAGWAFWSWHHSDEAIMRTGWSLRRLLKDGDLKL